MMTKVNTGQKEFAPTPQLKLTEEEGNFIKGILKKKLKDGTYANKFNYFITVKDLKGTTIVWDKETKTELPLDAIIGGDVFVRGFTQLQKGLAGVAEGQYVEITYTGKGVAKKGQKAPFLVDVRVEV